MCVSSYLPPSLPLPPLPPTSCLCLSLSLSLSSPPSYLLPLPLPLPLLPSLPLFPLPPPAPKSLPPPSPFYQEQLVITHPLLNHLLCLAQQRWVKTLLPLQVGQRHTHCGWREECDKACQGFIHSTCTCTSCILHHACYITHATSCMLHHAGYIMHATSCILHHAYYIMHATSCMLHHACYIMHATSCMLHIERNGKGTGDLIWKPFIVC